MMELPLLFHFRGPGSEDVDRAKVNLKWNNAGDEGGSKRTGDSRSAALAYAEESELCWSSADRVVSWDNLKVSVRLARFRLLISPTMRADFRRWKTGRCLFATHALRQDWYVDPPGVPGVFSSNARVSVCLILLVLLWLVQLGRHPECPSSCLF
jgi:hypothetical protein